MAAAKAEWDHKASLISEAKAEFNKKNNPAAAKALEKKSEGAGFDSMCIFASGKGAGTRCSAIDELGVPI
jgi:hypothetical protein